MAADSDGSLTAVVICEGNLHDPEFPRKFRHILAKLKYILQQPKKSKKLKVNKVEPWNSVRVTLSIPKEAAARLRQLASEGSNALRALGILSVQLEGDSVISLRLVGQDLILRTDNTTTGRVQEAGSSNTTLNDLSQILGSRMQQTTAGPSSCSTQSIPPTPSPSISEPVAGPSNRNIMPPKAVVVPVGISASSSSGNSANVVGGQIAVNGPTTTFDKPPLFKSPNTVCPMDGKLPVPPLTNIAAESHEYPFESMTQARVIQRRENTMAVVAALGAGVQSATAPVVGNTPLAIGQTQQVTPPPLTIPVAGPPSDSLTQQQSTQQIVKSPFMQPPPPPYPTATGTQHPMKVAPLAVSHPLQQQQQQQSNAITLSNNTNALSSPLLVNLLQNDGVNQVKVAPVASSSVILQSSQTSTTSQIASNLPNHAQPDGVLLLNNSNSSTDSSRISISPSIPVPSPSQTISNIPSNAMAASSTGVPQPGVGVLSQNILGPPIQQTNMPAGIRVQQQRFALPPQAAQSQSPTVQHLMPQHQIIHTGATGVQIQRIATQPGQQVMPGGMGPVPGVNQATFRHPQQQPSQHITIQQQTYSTAPPAQSSPHPSLVNQPPHQQQPPVSQHPVLANNFNHPRWPFKPMDSATKSSFQEFARYQMQYNLQQEMNSQSTIPPNVNAHQAGVSAPGGVSGMGTSGTIAAATVSQPGDKSGISDALGLGSYLDELSKTDLDSLLLPGLNDLEAALELDGKNDLESLLDAKDLDLDLIDQDGSTTVLSSTVPAPARPMTMGMQPPAISTAPAAASVMLSQPPGPGMQQNKISRLADTHQKNSFVKKDQKPSATSGGKERQYLINPLTGELEPMPSDEESDPDDRATDNMDVFNELNSEVSNSLFSDDDNSCSTAFSKTSDHSDTERSTNSEASSRSKYSKSKKEKRESSYSSKKSKPSIKNNLLREKLQQGIKDKISGKSKQPKEKVTTKAKLISIDGKDSPSEKIKLRLKLEKSEPVSPAYKVDVSFVPSPKRAQTLPSATSGSISNYSSSSQSSLSITPNSSPSFNSQQSSGHVSSSASNHASSQSPHGEELRVPPLHISLRGKNSIIIKNSKKDRKKSQSGGEEDESYLKKNQLKRNATGFDEQTAVVNRYVVTNNEHYNHLSNSISIKPSSQGKPITRPSSHEEYPVSNSFSKSVLENGEEADKIVVNKRNADAATVVSQNGMIVPETKRRRMSQSQEHQQQHSQDDKSGNLDAHMHVQAPIGSTNVGTIPAHSSLSKNPKGSNNNNNSSNFINKIHKTLIKSGKPLVVVKQSKSPPNNPVKDPGKSPPVTTASLESTRSLQPTMSTTPSASQLNSSATSNSTVTLSASSASISLITSKSQKDSAEAVSTVALSKTAITSCLLPQGSSDAISKEKFKQKLLEFQITEVKDETEKEKVISVVPTSKKDSERNSMSTDPSPDVTEVKASTPLTPLENPCVQESPVSIEKSSSATVSTPSSNVRESPANEPLGGQTFQEADLKEEIPVAEQQPKPTSHSGNPSSLEIGLNILNNGGGNNNARNSPGSQAQGEDSGIESMDALSEKSPHQSASPQQGDSAQPHQMPAKRVVEIVHTKIEQKISLAVKDEPEDEITNIHDIEAALAKMEGINDHFLSECESPKLNGDHSMKEESLLENLTDEKILMCAVKMEHADELAAIMGGTSSGKSSPVLSPLTDTKLEPRDLNENKEISSNISLERQLIDECCKKSLKPNTNVKEEVDKSTRMPSPAKKADENTFEENVIQTATTAAPSSGETAEAKSSSIRIKSPESSMTAIKEEPATVVDVSPCISTSSPLECDVISETNDKSVVDIKEILTPISIEIPTQSDPGAPRVRTRASSKLESPLDAPKQSPQLDSPATANSLKSNLRLSAAAIDKLSPKVNAGKGAGSTTVTGNKRKRQGSESSTQSCVSDDTSGRSGGSSAKRTRPNSANSATANHAAHENASSTTGKSTNATNKKSSGSGKNKKSPDESSDSDEPLIEVAGKVRGSKGSGSKSSENSDNKVLRNHRASSQHSRTTTSHSTPSANSNTATHATTQSSVPTKTIRGASASHPNTSSTSSSSATAHSSSGSTIASSNSHNNTSQSNTHCTRASSATSGAAAVSSGSAASTTAANSVNAHPPTGTNALSGQHQSTAQTSTVQDDRPRRSVRASAAANKIIYSRSGGITSTANHANNVNANNDASNKTGSGNTKGTSGNSATSSDGVEPRRKTRSAAGGEVTEGRRRRGSRDISSNEEDDDEDDDDIYQYDNVDIVDEEYEDYDDDIGSQTTQIDIDDLFNSTSQFEVESLDESEQQVNIPLGTSDNNTQYVQHYFDQLDDHYERQFKYVGACTSKEIRMPEIELDDQIEPTTISDYDATDDEPSPVMTSTDEEDDEEQDDSNDANDDDHQGNDTARVVVRNMRIENTSDDFKDADECSSVVVVGDEKDGEQFSMPIVAIPISIVKR